MILGFTDKSGYLDKYLPESSKKPDGTIIPNYNRSFKIQNVAL